MRTALWAPVNILTPKLSLLANANKLAHSNRARIERVAQGGGAVRPQAQRRKARDTSFLELSCSLKNSNLVPVGSRKRSGSECLADLQNAANHDVAV